MNRKNLPMERIVTLPDGQRIVLEGQVVPDAWVVSQKRANGHVELSIRNHVIWAESDKQPGHPNLAWPDYIAQYAFDPAKQKRLELERLQELEEKRLQQLEKSAQRAKTACRWVIKSQGLNEMLTLTYRENQTDRELCKEHFKQWVRRMKAALGGEFNYCASFEKQERGAMHVHVACHKLPTHGKIRAIKIKAFDLGTKIWRSIIGENNGLCFVGGNTKFGGKRRNMSLAKLAAYVSKYIMKDFKDSPLGSNRYSRSNGLVLPKTERMHFHSMTMAEVIDLAFHVGEGDVLVSHSVSTDLFGEQRYWMCTEPMPIRYL
jgi:hypothetical protein